MSDKLRLSDPPDQLAPVRRMIQDGAKFRDIRPRFAQRLEAFSFYARVHNEMYLSPARAEECCCIHCGRALELETMEITWRTTIRSVWDWIMVPGNAFSLTGEINIPRH